MMQGTISFHPFGNQDSTTGLPRHGTTKEAQSSQSKEGKTIIVKTENDHPHTISKITAPPVPPKAIKRKALASNSRNTSSSLHPSQSPSSRDFSSSRGLTKRKKVNAGNKLTVFGVIANNFYEGFQSSPYQAGIILLVLTVFTWMLYPNYIQNSSLERFEDPNSHRGLWKRFESPQYEFHSNDFENIPIRAAVYYGRKDRVRILEVYLRRNLKKNGGVLDSVIFLENAKSKRDISFLYDVILPSQPNSYSVMEMHNGFSYDFVKPGELYFKIDDDIVFIEDGTFENMLATKFSNPGIQFISANIINHPRMTYIHNFLGAYKSYYFSDDASWNWRNESAHGLDYFFDSEGKPLKPTWDALGDCSWKSWKCAWLAHENFFHNYYHNNLDVYRFRSLDLHAYGYERWSINLMLINGSDFTHPNQRDDEQFLTVLLPANLRRHSLVSGYAIASRFSFFTQAQQISKTNLLSRYLELATNYYGTPLPNFKLPAAAVPNLTENPTLQTPR